MPYEDFRVTGRVQPTEHGSVKIEQILPAKTSEGAAFLTLMGHGRVKAGEAYTLLHVNGKLVMSDTTDEWIDHIDFIHEARGRVLIHGLGLGCALQAILLKPEVEHVDVVEISQDVLDVISPYHADPRVTFHQGDAFEMARRWPRGSRWDAVWTTCGTTRARPTCRSTRSCCARSDAGRAGRARGRTRRSSRFAGRATHGEVELDWAYTLARGGQLGRLPATPCHSFAAAGNWLVGR